jgi:tRNA(fMet)-specific endonuclease VapC
MWMLDTNICSDLLRKRPPSLLERFYASPLDDLYLSAVVAAELHYGAMRVGSPEFSDYLEQWLSLLSIAPWPCGASAVYAHIRFELEKRGTPIGNMDLLIAAHALTEDAVLVTKNPREFQRISGLKLENWV